MAEFARKSPPANWRAMGKTQQLEPERATEVEPAAGSQVGTRYRVACELRQRKRVSEYRVTCGLNDRGDSCKVGMIEGVQRCEAELKRCAFIELHHLGDARVEVVERCVATIITRDIAEWRTENGFGNASVGDIAHLLVRYCYDL